jgi:hypothetical protein
MISSIFDGQESGQESPPNDVQFLLCKFSITFPLKTMLHNQKQQQHLAAPNFIVV